MVFDTSSGRKTRIAGSPGLRRAALAGLLLAAAGALHAQGGEPGAAPDAGATPAPAGAKPQWTLTFAPTVYHWKYDPDHKPAYIFALERRVGTDPLYGLSLFRNSFAQPSAYAYVGQRWDQLAGLPSLSAKLTAGLIYGYTGQYEDKVPFHWNGFFPAVVPALAYRLGSRDSLDVMVLGTAALAFAYSHDF